MGLSFTNDYVWYNSSILTIDYGSIPGSYYLHLHNKKQFAMRTGCDWVFYNNDKPRLILSFMYQFAFKDAGYFRYHFTEPSQGIDFYYQTASRGNGFSIKAGFPIKLWQINNK